MAHQGNICPYCARPCLIGGEKPEHPIPAALGASLSVDTVCEPCNAWSGREIDQPFLEDDWVLEYRSQSGVVDPRRGSRARPPRSPFLRGGFTEEGDFVSLDEHGQPQMRSRIIDLGEGRFEIRASSEEEVARLLRRVERRTGKTAKLEAVTQHSSQPRIRNQIIVKPVIWQRMAAKIGLAVGSVVYDLDWRTGLDAGRLREWLNGEDAATEDGQSSGFVPRQVSGTPFEGFCENGEHLLLFLRSGEGTHLAVVLFGAVSFSVPVETSGEPTRRTAWRLDPKRPRVDGLTTLDVLLAGAAQRLLAEEGKAS